MAKETKTDTARSELVRLLEGLEYYRSWSISCIESETGEVTEDDLNQIVMPSSFFLQVFEETKGRSGTAVVTEVRRWYSHAASDLCYMINSGDEAWAGHARQFLKSFQAEVGFDFFAEAGLLRKFADKALKSRKISTEEDYYSLRELENDLSQSVVSPEELVEISEILRFYEKSADLG
ncbi:hypothetical protein [Dinoroseobacter sp. S375]|uniref:hypothetical protein n=1 Tax=Dinoroseobacter sp. S375 TaxID=3415136 RepID=UPI003C7EAEE6